MTNQLQFLGFMFRSDTEEIWSDSTYDRLLARQIFGLTEEQSQHPSLLF